VNEDMAMTVMPLRACWHSWRDLPDRAPRHR